MSESESIVPMGTVLKWGTVSGVLMVGGKERYYFISCNVNDTSYLPAGMVEREYERKLRSENEIQK